MPLAQIRGVSSYLTKDQKEQLIERVTDAILSVEGEGLRSVTWVLVDDVPEGNWGIGGKSITAEDVRNLASP
jgi:4-oxalocrotonate tautomerase